MSKVEILLASYNGERYIAEQIESILNQDCKDFTLHILDDCSADRTVEIVRGYVKRYPDKISLSRNEKNLGSAGSFFKLLKSSKAEYVMFCDQDDVWLENKISLSLEKMEGAAAPTLLHTDLTVTDENLRIKHPSMFKSQHLQSGAVTVRSLAVQNVVTGCTMMLNRELVNRLCAVALPDNIPVHDWWIALYTACCGEIIFLDKATVYYRQHGTNVCGARDMSDFRYIISRAKATERARLMLQYGYNQAEKLSELYGNALGEENRAFLSAYGELSNKPYMERLKFVVKNRVFKSGIIRKIGQLIFL